MMAKPITAILAVALLLSASGTVGSFYLVSSQGQTITDPAELTLSESEASPGSVIEVEGINFGANSQVSIYFMSAGEADLTDGSAFILQGIDPNQGTITTTEPEDTSAFFDADSDVPHTLGDLLDTTSISEHNLLVVLEEGVPMNGTMSLECEDENIAQGAINGTIGTFGVSPGTYSECSLSISDADITDTGEIEEPVVVSDSEEDYENSLVTTETADEEGTLESSVTVPNVEGGEYVMLAVGNDRITAVSALSVTDAEFVTGPAADTSVANATEGIIMNETITPAPEEEEDEEELVEEESTELLTVGIISNSTEGLAPATFEFQANLTGGIEPYTYLWDFGDGSEESDEQTVLHTFEEAGIYNVTLTATDTDDQEASDSIEISVEAPPLPPPPPTTITEPLTVGIISNSTEGVAPATFEFQANLTGGIQPYVINWDFGDGSEESDEQTVLHTFEEAGTYEVTLTATDTDDQEASDSIEISVEEAPAEVVEEVGEATTTTVQNQTQNNQTGTAGEEEPTVQLDETSAEPGSPLAISGGGFQPDTPIQIFINNVQITNVLTNVEGSFNTVVIVPTTVVAGSAQVVVRTEQTTIVQNVNIIQLDGRTNVPSTLRLTAVSATDNGEALRNAPVTVFDASSGEVVERGRTPMDIELQEGTYSIFYSDFGRFEFESAEPGRWIDTPDGGSGLITIREGRNTTVTALYSEQPAPPPPPRVTDNSITLRAQDTQGNPIQGMFVTVYNAEAAEKIEQGFTELGVDDLPPGTYPVFFANFEDLEFVSASPGTWIQTPFGGVGLVSIPDDGEDHNIVVTAEYNRTTVVEEDQFNIQAPLDLEGNIFTITSNQTRPEGPFVMSGTFALRVSDEEPVSATLSAFFMSAREDSNENVDLESQRSRDHDTFQIVDLKPRVARPIGLNSYVVSGTADLLLNGDMYSNDERIVVIVRGGEELTPTNIEIDFRGDERYSAANRLDTLYGVVSSGFQ
ncbi:MAG: PKD domain-containing protein [Thermoproteota archaeon]|nr:PKD domain-containing protein [Thermoproteota archaeon]